MRDVHVVTCFLLRRDKDVDEVLLLRRSGQVGTYRGRWAGVSGYLEAESALLQAYREMEEEVGVGGSDARLLAEGEPLVVVDETIDTRWTVHPFLFELLRPEGVRLDWEHTESRWVRAEEVAGMETVPGLAEALSRVYKGSVGVRPAPVPQGQMMIDFGVAQEVEAQSTGEPGQRTFHLRVLGEGGQSASLKLEKQHLVGLRTGLRELLAKIGYEGEPEVRGAVHFPSTADYDFPVGSLGIGFSPGDGAVVLEVTELEAEGDEEATTIHVRLTPRQSASLATQLEELIAAGRPICPLCWAPIDPEGHVCVKSNGHSRQPIPDEQPDEG